ncbi:MAG: magnesium chelatase domain-containing protein, partial [Lachnospiraceae bacterium]|nr:magnesium chelatase domain-containing protein [Lachnospiraceae bacterium]
MIGEVISGGVHGIDAHIVRVECDIASGFPAFELVGSLAPEVKESRERVVTALRNSDVVIPNKRITVNLSPANLRKHGTGYDLPVAVSILMAMDIIDIKSVENTLFIGELSLGGEITGVRGVLPVVKKGRDEGISRFIVPKTNAKEAAVIDDVIVICVDNLTELISYLTGALNVERVEPSHYGLSKSAEQDFNDKKILDYDFAKISGQKVAKRGLEIATAGLHNVLMVGPPGTGKTLLAKSL